MTILIVKLVTGEEIIGDCTTQWRVSTTISKPCMLQLVPSQNNSEQPVMALVPYAAYTENHCIVIDVEKIIWIESPIKELYNQYNNIFGACSYEKNFSEVKQTKQTNQTSQPPESGELVVSRLQPNSNR